MAEMEVFEILTHPDAKFQNQQGDQAEEKSEPDHQTWRSMRFDNFNPQVNEALELERQALIDAEDRVAYLEEQHTKEEVGQHEH